ncbi:hypothetical protein EJC51_13295 [Streptomyces aquilus]|uniref:Uncharacterized protein n=1 Tax=Streptomyces aquilus TaxID=2548456 RepID=A0A3S9HY22_9ACTN|nr:hypothetical protein [Streptomyces aquilus]AZP17006.1 hypothetical protein EJC51_13295 [Streptomyces aquilus]
MSGIEPSGREGRRETDMRGSASDNGQVYLSRGNQYISHLHLHEEPGGSARELAQAGMRGAALELTQERVTLLIRTLSLTQAELRARCAELEEEARQARAEGRAEALAEMQQQLQAAELRVMKTQEMMRAAVQEREKAEALLTQAHEELAQRRRAEERREKERARLAALARAEAETAPPAVTPDEEGQQFTEFLERAEEQLGRVRDDLRLLGHEITGQDGTAAAAQVIEGQVVRQPGESREQAPKEAKPALVHPPTAKTPEAKTPSGSPSRSGGNRAATTPRRTTRTPVPGPRRPFRIALIWLLCLIPGWVPLLVVTMNRAVYATDASVVEAVVFTVASVALGAVVFAGVGFAVFVVLALNLDRDSEEGAGFAGVGVAFAATLGLLIAGFYTPLDAPGPLGAWGKALASAMGFH